ncbi:hypothetical protein BB560_005087, partial [Smittium megazygosporum]
SDLLDSRSERFAGLIAEIIKTIRMLRNANKINNSTIIPQVNVYLSDFNVTLVNENTLDPDGEQNESLGIMNQLSIAEIIDKDTINVLEKYSSSIKHHGKCSKISFFYEKDLQSVIQKLANNKGDIFFQAMHNVIMHIPHFESVEVPNKESKPKNVDQKISLILEHINKIQITKEKLEMKINNPRYVLNAPASAKKSDLIKLSSLESKIKKLTSEIELLEKFK